MTVSIVVPMLNEVRNVEQLVGDIAAQDYRGQSEVIVADGGSVDGSVEALLAAAERRELSVTVIPNTNRWMAHGLNLGIRNARGYVIVRLDCHTRYAPDYVRRMVETLIDTGASMVGPAVAPRGRTATERAVAIAMSSPFGGVHWSRHDSHPNPIETDTVYLGTFPRHEFDRIGGYDEDLFVVEDEDFSFRLRRAGGRIIQNSRVQVDYIPEGSLRGVLRKYYRYGVWKVAVTAKHRRLLSIRSAVPLLFVTSLAALASTAGFSRPARRLLVLESAVYVGAASLFATLGASRRRELSLVPQVMVVFPAFHIGYGLGTLHGLFRLAVTRRSRAAGRALPQ